MGHASDVLVMDEPHIASLREQPKPTFGMSSRVRLVNRLDVQLLSDRNRLELVFGYQFLGTPGEHGLAMSMTVGGSWMTIGVLR